MGACECPSVEALDCIGPTFFPIGSDLTERIILKERGLAVSDESFIDNVQVWPQGLLNVTRMTIQAGPHLVDSAVDIGSIDWVTEGLKGIVIVKLGPFIPTPFSGTVTLIVYDPVNSNGIPWIPSADGAQWLVRIA